MRPNPHFALTDEAVVRDLVREHPWATLVSHTSNGLVASHYAVVLDEEREELSVLAHVGRPDEELHELGEHELLMIVQGPHGYVSPSWYPEGDRIPTWNFVVAHLSGVPEVLGEEENLATLERLVARMEAPVAAPRLLNATPEAAAGARRIARGTVGLRLTPTRVVAKRKMSQNKSPETVRTIVAALEGDGPYASPELAREMRRVHDLAT